MIISSYKTIIFDCDGVILNSNPIKKQAFYNAALSYGQEAAEKLEAYHRKYGGKSRYEKFDYFIHSIMGRDSQPGEIENLLNKFAQELKSALLNCEIASGLKDLREATKKSRWMVVSGGDQIELRELFKTRGLDHYFDAGVFGSPDSKDAILNREFVKDNIKHPAVFLGDSYYDYEAADRAGLDFVFIAGWSEFESGVEYFEYKGIPIIWYLADMVDI